MSLLDPVETAVVAGALVIGGKYARGGEAPKIDNFIGIAGIAIGLAILETMNEQFASAFAVLILVTVSFVHLPAIVKAAGFGRAAAK